MNKKLFVLFVMGVLSNPYVRAYSARMMPVMEKYNQILGVTQEGQPELLEFVEKIFGKQVYDAMVELGCSDYQEQMFRHARFSSEQEEWVLRFGARTVILIREFFFAYSDAFPITAILEYDEEKKDWAIRYVVQVDKGNPEFKKLIEQMVHDIQEFIKLLGIVERAEKHQLSKSRAENARKEIGELLSITDFPVIREIVKENLRIVHAG